MTRKIMHLDLDAFFCSVEELKNPSLVGKPFAVGGMPGQRGVVSSCSYAARQFGVRSAMPTGKALQLCPGLILVSGHHSDYEAYSEQVMDILKQISPLVEIVSIDEAFVDFSDLPDNPEVLARRTQQQVRARVNLPCSIGLASNKLVAKIATDAGKAENRTGRAPCAIKYVKPGSEEEFLAPLPVSAIWGVGPKMSARLNDLGIEKIGDLLKIPESTLRDWVGNAANFLLQAARGQDASPVVTEHDLKSISQETTFSRDLCDPQEIERTIQWLTEKVARRLRENRMCGDTVRIKVRLKDFSGHTRQVKLDAPTDVESVILKEALELFRQFHQAGQYIRLIGVGVSGLGESWHQMGLWEAQTEKEIKLHQTMDLLQQKYGRKALQRGKMPEHKLDLLLSSTYWVQPKLFMAGPFPMSYQQDGTEEIMDILLGMGIRQFIDLTETHEHALDHYRPALTRTAARKNLAVKYSRFAIVDRGLPSTGQMREILDAIDASLEARLPVYVHCYGGIGRTGTVVGCWLVRHGLTGRAALGRIMELRKEFAGPYDSSPETPEQKAFVVNWKEPAGG
jgi:DNA polymerase-4